MTAPSAEGPQDLLTYCQQHLKDECDGYCPRQKPLFSSSASKIAYSSASWQHFSSGIMHFQPSTVLFDKCRMLTFAGCHITNLVLRKTWPRVCCCDKQGRALENQIWMYPSTRSMATASWHPGSKRILTSSNCDTSVTPVGCFRIGQLPGSENRSRQASLSEVPGVYIRRVCLHDLQTQSFSLSC